MSALTVTHQKTVSISLRAKNKYPRKIISETV